MNFATDVLKVMDILDGSFLGGGGGAKKGRRAGQQQQQQPPQPESGASGGLFSGGGVGGPEEELTIGNDSGAAQTNNEDGVDAPIRYERGRLELMISQCLRVLDKIAWDGMRTDCSVRTFHLNGTRGANARHET